MRQHLSSNLTKIFFQLERDQWHGYATESLFAEELADGKFRLENSPFFVKGVSFGDMINAVWSQDRYVFTKVIVHSGNSTYRVLFSKDADLSKLADYWKPLEKLGCTFEENNKLSLKMLTIDVPSNADIYTVYRHLEAGVDAGVWDFEEGHCGHILN